MAFYVRFESKQDLDLLTRLVENTVARLRTNISTFSDIAEPMGRVVDSLHSAAPVSDGHLIGVPENVIQDDKAKEKAAKEAKAAARKRAPARAKGVELCSQHKSYQAKQVPRTECEGCWAAYKKFNPTKYTMAWNKFKRRQNRA